MTTQAIIYTRFSPRPNAAECTSNEEQEERCKQYCNKKEYTMFPYRSYQDRKVSGSILNRPGLQAALGALEPGMILVVDSSDRLARDMLVNLTIRHRVKEAGATIEYADGSPTSTTPEGELVEDILAAVSSFQRKCIQRNTKRGLARKRKNGERTTGKIPIGWREDPKDLKRLVVCEEEREAIIRICYGASQGWPSKKIASDLDVQLPYCRGKEWSPRTIRKLIKRHAFWAGPDGDLSLEPKHP